MAGPSDGDGTLVYGAARTGVGDTGRGGVSSGVNTGGTIVTLREGAVGVRLGTLGDGAGKLSWTATGGAGHGAIGAEAVGEVSVILEKMLETSWMAEN